MINNIVLQSDEKILICGEPSKVENVLISGVQRLDSLGAPDAEFVSPIMGTNDTVTAIAKLADGSLVVGGTFLNATSSKEFYVAGLDPDGFFERHDGWFETQHPNAAVLSLATTTDQKVLVGGEFSDLHGDGNHGLIRLDESGVYDPNFVTQLQAKSAVHSVRSQVNKVLIGGNFTLGDIDSCYRNFARLNEDGSIDSSFATEVDDWVFSVLPLQNGDVMIGGVFKNVNDVERKYLARLQPNGQLDPSFNPDFGLLGWVYSVAQQQDGRILIGGEFTSIDGVEINHLARLNQDGSLDSSFNIGAGANDSVKVITVQADGRILIGGEFTEFAGVSRRHLARLNQDGTIDRSFGDESY